MLARQLNTTKDYYLILLFLHILIGFSVFLFKPLSIVYAVAISAIGFIDILKNKNKNNQVLCWCAYVVCAEVFLRMTKGNIGNEFGKYVVMIFVLMGIYYKSFSKNAIPIWIFLLLLIPGIVISTTVLNLETNVRKAIIFNISGPVCLGISAIYCYQRVVTPKQIENLFKMMTFPIITTLAYLYFYTPSIRDLVVGTASNSATSGGFGPNQVSTILGLGMFVFFVRTIFYSKNIYLQALNGFLLLLATYRGLITFSRGGVITGGIMILLLLGKLFIVGNSRGKMKLMVVFGAAIFALIGIWGYSSYQTNGLIERRYANEDALGREKDNLLSGREILIETELNMFLDNPIFGIGVGKNKETRKELTGLELASHNELTRMLAEHGSLGILALLILFATPFLLSVNNPQNLYMYSFFIFWLLTINHAAMRLAAPAFIYALTLLKFTSFEEPALHRK
ncbi:O-antigen ligase [Flavobacterium arsenatis]|uniref:O-antigen ligase n=1 Tax=Flavobacterium arsenatis TaxID=1484332 RepID=A0ABU1TM11_9FLAO|nr:O-antigen ligase family protein [Flavobacterium arsenatis]MDR6967005.1 O-antigen ligase [Flavobacterium arsenatis]